MRQANGLGLATTDLDLNRLVDFHPAPHSTRYVVVEGSKRDGTAGVILGTIALRHAGGYEVVLQLDNGRIDTFGPHGLRPERTDC